MGEPLYYRAFYGKLSLIKATCSLCETDALIVNNHYTCCGMIFRPDEEDYERQYREVIDYRKRPYKKSRYKRRRPFKFRQKEAVHEQDYACFWCDHFFGLLVYRDGNPVALKIVWDHVVPVSKGGSNTDDNFVASCQICNGLKSSKVFPSIEAARKYLKNKWIEKGYSDAERS